MRGNFVTEMKGLNGNKLQEVGKGWPEACIKEMNKNIQEKKRGRRKNVIQSWQT